MPLKLLTKFSELTVSRVLRRLDISSKEDQWIVLISLESSTLIKSKANWEKSKETKFSTLDKKQTHSKTTLWCRDLTHTTRLNVHSKSRLLLLVMKLEKLLLNTRDPSLDVRRRLFVTNASVLLSPNCNLHSLRLIRLTKPKKKLVDLTQTVLTKAIEKLFEHLFCSIC